MKTLLVGMNNPLSTSDRFAFYPKPSRSSGARLLRLLQRQDGSITSDHYLRAFDRTNVMTGKRWSLEEARKQFQNNRDKYSGRRILVFAKLTLQAMGLQVKKVGEFTKTDDFEYAYVPHPSGLNRFYNSEKNREDVSWLLYLEYQKGIAE